MKTTAARTALAAGAIAVGLASSLAAPAHAGGNDVVRIGSCSGPSDWKLKAKPDNGRIEVEAEVDSNVVGQTWHWRIKHDGNVSAKGAARTTAPSGSFEVRRMVVNSAGSDHIGLRATNAATGETCRGGLNL